MLILTLFTKLSMIKLKFNYSFVEINPVSMLLNLEYLKKALSEQLLLVSAWSI